MKEHRFASIQVGRRHRSRRKIPTPVLVLFAAATLPGLAPVPLVAQQGAREAPQASRLGQSPSAASPARRAPSARPANPSSPRQGTVRPASSGHRAGHRGYSYRGYGRYGYYPYGRYRYYPFSSYPYYRSYYSPYAYAPYVRVGLGGGYGYQGYEMGALDLDVKPKKAEVYVDGNYIGVVDKYDGFPRYLWLRKGTFELSFYREGYETLTRAVTIYPGVVIDVKDRLVPGQSVRPEPKTPPPDQYEEPEGEDDREWNRRDAGRYEVGDATRRPRREGRRQRSDLRSEPAQVRIQVRPPDAAVYLDGRLLGSGDELSRLHSALVVDSGEHLLEVVRPGYENKELVFEVAVGEELEIEVELEK